MVNVASRHADRYDVKQPGRPGRQTEKSERYGMASRAHEIFPLFFIVWLLLGIGGAIFFYGSRDAALKRRLFPFFIVFTSALFIGFLFYIQGRIPVVLAIAVLAIGFFNLKATRFCDACGQMVISRMPFASPKYCQRCGAELKN
jgi:hypothetical protein